MDTVLRELRKDRGIIALKGWRDEVCSNCFRLDWRAAVFNFFCRKYGSLDLNLTLQYLAIFQQITKKLICCRAINSSSCQQIINFALQCYEVRASEFSSKKLLKMDRCATCLFGIRNYGVDINGYVNHPKLGICIWLQQRSSTKQTWPSKYFYFIIITKIYIN